MNKGQVKNQEIIDDEPSKEEQMLLSHMDSQDIYEDEDGPNLVQEDETEDKYEKENRPLKTIKQIEGNLSKLVERPHKNLDDSLEIRKEQNIERQSITDNILYVSKNKELENNLRPKTTRSQEKRRVNLNVNVNNSYINNTNDRYLILDPKIDEDERNKSVLSYQHKSDRINIKKNQRRKNHEEVIDKPDKRKILEIDDEIEFEEKDIFIDESRSHYNIQNKINQNETLRNSFNNFTLSNQQNNNKSMQYIQDPNSQLNPSSSMKNIQMMQSSSQFQQNPFNQYTQSNMNQYPIMMENNIGNMNPLMNSGYMMPNQSNVGNPYMQNNSQNLYPYNQYGFNPYGQNNPYMNQQQNQQPFNYNMNNVNPMNQMMNPMNNMNPNNMNTPQINHQEFMQIKVNLTNLESENLALKQKLGDLNRIQSINKSRDVENSETTKEIFHLKLKVETLIADKIALGRELEESRNNYDNFENEKLGVIEMNYNRIIKSKDDLLKKNKEDLEKMKAYIDNIKKEHAKLKKAYQNSENERNSLKEKLNQIETETEENSKKNQSENLSFNNLRDDFDNLVKKYQALKNQYDYSQNLLEEFKSDNYYLKKEVEHFSKKQAQLNTSRATSSSVDSRLEKMNGATPKLDESSYSIETTDTLKLSKNLIKQSSMKNDANKEINLEINKLQQKISELMNEKNRVENDLLKIPDKSKSLTMIQKQQILEQKLKGVETEINKYKKKFREMKNQLK